MSNNKQDHIVDTNKMVTAVEWLFNEYVDKGVITIEAIDKALEIEKEQIIETWHNGYNNQSPMIDEDNCGQQYYTETYEHQ